jgi:hypothetical protein
MSRIPKPIARFRVYPHPPQKWRFECLVWRTSAEMVEYATRVWQHSATNYNAICLSLATDEITKSRSRKLGEILFTTHHLTHAIIAHELIHAASHHLQIVCGRDAVIISAAGESHETEETVAHGVSNMVGQFGIALRAAGLGAHD